MQIHSQCSAEQLHHFNDVVSLSTLVLNSRDRHEKMATEFYTLQNTP